VLSSQTSALVENCEATLDFRVMLHQQNTHILESKFTEISTPGSPHYQQYLTKAEISALVSPPVESRVIVQEWLQSGGMDNIEWHGDYYTVSGSICAIEKLMNVHMAVLQSVRTGKRTVRSIEMYTIPDKVKSHVQFIVGISDLISKRRYGFHVHQQHSDSKSGSDDDSQYVSSYYQVSDQPSQAVVSATAVRQMFNISSSLAVIGNSSQCAVEFESGLYYVPEDLKQFTNGMSLPQPNPVAHIGGFKPGNQPDGESTLDVQYLTAVGQNGTNTFWVLNGWLLDFAQDLFNMANPPLVNSQSWGTEERSDLQDYNNRVDNEYMKLGLRGVSIVSASGDSGAIGEQQCTGNQYVFNPGYPAASSYTTSVGATMVVGNGETTSCTLPPACSDIMYPCVCNGKQDPANDPIGSTGAGFSTGGGFSVWNPRPQYQDAVVSAYLNDNTIPKPRAKYFNSSNRAFPDISAIGYNLLIYQSGSGDAVQGNNQDWRLIGGTSAATPIIAGMITLINSKLQQMGKAPVGFFNSLLYKMAHEDPSTVTSVGNLNTNNKNGCPYGYVSNPNGYDPVTGLGYPQLDAIMRYIERNADMFASL
jgi:subtilase family serine protease